MYTVYIVLIWLKRADTSLASCFHSSPYCIKLFECGLWLKLSSGESQSKLAFRQHPIMPAFSTGAWLLNKWMVFRQYEMAPNHILCFDKIQSFKMSQKAISITNLNRIIINTVFTMTSVLLCVLSSSFVGDLAERFYELKSIRCPFIWLIEVLCNLKKKFL